MKKHELDTLEIYFHRLGPKSLSLHRQLQHVMNRFQY